ncbi:Alpha-ketoglutarate-dependent dioxygenase alkB 3 [Nymphon striatum]|nr:Alpha-ketoglutarate-dependent dioxygenase alkB 3 [Nymphon striatum]
MSQNRGSRVQGGWNRPKSQKGPVKQGQGQEVLQRMGLQETFLLQSILKRKASFFGHIARGSAGEELRMIVAEGWRKVGRGRRRRRWMDDLELVTGTRDVRRNMEMAEDREQAANPTSTCQYLQSSNVKTVDTVPQSKFISTSGNHILSHGSNGISNIVFHPDFIQDKEMQDNLFKSLNESICWEDREVIIKGNTYPQPRLVAWFGPLPYEYSGLKFKPSQGNWPSCVQYIHDCIKEETGFEFNSVLINLYRQTSGYLACGTDNRQTTKTTFCEERGNRSKEDGKDSMGWHSDNELSMGVHPIIASVSFGDMRRFEMRRRNVKLDSNNEGKAEVTVPLKSGSLLIMDGETQRDWEHRIPKEYHDRKALCPKAHFNELTDIM